MPWGTIANTAAIIAGSLIGTFLKKRFPDHIKKIVFQAIGLATIVIGINMALASQKIVLLVFSMIIGGIIGEIIRLETHIEGMAGKLKNLIKTSSPGFSEGLISAFLIFCMGSMTIIGSIDEGLTGNHSILLTKSVLDGFTSIALASTYGIGVLFSSLLVFIFQGGITLLAQYSRAFFTDMLIAQLTSVGGIMIIGLGLNILGIQKIKILNLLPALLVAVLFVILAPILGTH